MSRVLQSRLLRRARTRAPASSSGLGSTFQFSSPTHITHAQPATTRLRALTSRVARGHHPWHTSFRKRILEDVVDPETGEVTDSKIKIKVEKRLNVVQVSDNPRHSAATEIQSMQMK